ncbi:putative necrosis-inducing factor-domain-containing protein [Sordaria brevicollis]|uniref:Necrosis-inducing factor-domain-containing protein n=1 Tax=Sordaria brevicollis TaxID=83679 RepID=A0AAE0UDB6_SORBR|nr:putative necrosis-inducing factor-domain-containing protein [Sordaria brevicollis]
MRASTILYGITATALASGAVIPKDAANTGEAAVQTAVSPDGYRYVVESEPYVEDTITTADGVTHNVLVHPAFKRSVDAHGTSPNPNKTKRLSYKKGNGDTCDDTTLINKTSGASPSVGDCAAVRDYYRNDNGHFEAAYFWDLWTSDWCRLVITRSCVFGIKSSHTDGTYFGSSNIADLVDLSINRFQSNGRIGAEGETQCANGGPNAPSYTKWAIFAA